MLFRKKKEITPEIYSEDFCQSCSEKTKRRYEEGDYVYGSGLQCKKCMSSNTIVTAIYGEYLEENTRARA
jgi:ribosomal protein L37AE/L43A